LDHEGTKDTKRGEADAVLRVLNEAFSADSAAIHALVCNRVPCNRQLGDHPTIQVSAPYGVEESVCVVGLLGVLNGALAAIDLPKVAAQFDETPTKTGFHRMTGFAFWTDPADG